MMAQPGALQIPAGMPMMGQPQQVQWMQRPAEIPGCPLGLEYLTQIDQLLVKQQLELLESKHVFFHLIQMLSNDDIFDVNSAYFCFSCIP